jgi:hypothetical protein
MLPLWCDLERECRVLRLTKPKEIEALLLLFEDVAAAEGWRPQGALRLRRDRSVYFSLETQDRMVGGLQLTRPDSSGRLSCHDLWMELPFDLKGQTAHVAVLALDPAFRGKDFLFWSLGIEMWRFCVTEGISTLFLEVTPRVLPIYRRLGWPLEVYGEKRLHWGEDCYLCSLDVPRVAEALLRRSGRSSYYRRIVSQAFRVSLPEAKRT